MTTDPVSSELKNSLESHLDDGLRDSLPNGTTIEIKDYGYEFIPKP